MYTANKTFILIYTYIQYLTVFGPMGFWERGYLVSGSWGAMVIVYGSWGASSKFGGLSEIRR